MSYDRSLSVLVFVGIAATVFIAAITSVSVGDLRQDKTWERRAGGPVKPEFLAQEFYDL